MNKALIVKAVLAILVIAGVVGYSVYHKKKGTVVAPTAEQSQGMAPASTEQPPSTVDQRYGNFTITDTKENK